MFIWQILNRLRWRNWSHNPNSPPLPSYCDPVAVLTQRSSFPVPWMGLILCVMSAIRRPQKWWYFKTKLQKALPTSLPLPLPWEYIQPNLLDHETYRAELSQCCCPRRVMSRAHPANLTCLQMHGCSPLWSALQAYIRRASQLTHPFVIIINGYSKPQMMGFVIKCCYRNSYSHIPSLNLSPVAIGPCKFCSHNTLISVFLYSPSAICAHLFHHHTWLMVW